MKVTKQQTPEELRAALGRRIKTLREQNGATQFGFAQAVGITQGQLSRWECGRADISIYRLDQLARALGTTAQKLLEGLL